jgi:predicted esterase
LVDRNTDIAGLLMHGDQDGFVAINFTFNFGTALTDAGSDVLVEVVEGANHNQLRDSDIVGDLIATWLLR